MYFSVVSAGGTAWDLIKVASLFGTISALLHRVLPSGAFFASVVIPLAVNCLSWIGSGFRVGICGTDYMSMGI
jgi:hypothetical protein